MTCLTLVGAGCLIAAGAEEAAVVGAGWCKKE